MELKKLIQWLILRDIFSAVFLDCFDRIKKEKILNSIELFYHLRVINPFNSDALFYTLGKRQKIRLFDVCREYGHGTLS